MESSEIHQESTEVDLKNICASGSVDSIITLGIVVDIYYSFATDLLVLPPLQLLIDRSSIGLSKKLWVEVIVGLVTLMNTTKYHQKIAPPTGTTSEQATSICRHTVRAPCDLKVLKIGPTVLWFVATE